MRFYVNTGSGARQGEAETGEAIQVLINRISICIPSNTAIYNKYLIAPEAIHRQGAIICNWLILNTKEHFIIDNFAIKNR